MTVRKSDELSPLINELNRHVKRLQDAEPGWKDAVVRARGLKTIKHLRQQIFRLESL